MTPWHDVRFAARTWRRTPALAAVVVLTLALGIAASTTAVTLTYSVLVRPFPFPAADRLVWITTYDTRNSDGSNAPLNSNRMPQFAHWARQLTSFDGIAAWNAATRPDVYTVTGAGTPERVNGLRVTQQLLPMLGAQFVAGNVFRPGDDAPGAAATVVLSDGYWQRRFGGRAEIIGRPLVIENVPHTVIGVVSGDFPFSASLFAGAPIDVYLPLTVTPEEDLGAYMAVLARLRRGASIERARAELAASSAAMATGQWQWMTALAHRVVPLAAPVTRDARTPLLLLLVAVGAILLLACANLANLLLARASSRRREIQLRAALGASRWQLFRHSLAESGLLVTGGGVAGVLLASAMIELLRERPWVSFARLGELRLDAAAIGAAAMACAIITLILGSIPLLHLRRQDLMAALRAYAGTTTDPRAASVQRLALGIQVAFAVLLTAAGGLLLRSLAHLLDVDPGFSTRGVMSMRVDPAGRLPPAARLPFFNQLLEAVSGVPGVESAALTINSPMDGRNMGWDVMTPGQPYDPATDSAFGRIVSPGYFRTAGIRLIAGRDFDARDQREAPPVVAINESFARRFQAAGRNPIGARLRVFNAEREVIAVVADVRHRSLDAESGREIYLPHTQAFAFFQAYDLVVRAAEAVSVVPAIREAIWSVDRNQAIGTPVELQDLVRQTLAPRHALTSVIAGFAAAALLLAGLGVYGVVRYRVAQRTRELAIRTALGSPARRIAATVLGDTMIPVAVGLAAGIPLALGAGGALRSYLFEVDAHDAPTLVAACAVVLGAAAAAAYRPARHAMRLDPMAALRSE